MHDDRTLPSVAVPSDDQFSPASGTGASAHIDPPNSPWRTLAAREVYRNPWLAVTEYQVVRPDGKPGIYGVVDPGANVTIVPLDAEGRVCLAGQFVYPARGYLWSLPSGRVDEGEEPLTGARRELAEETGLTAAEWTPLGSYYLTPGISSQVSYIYLARGLQVGDAQPEGTEQITTRWLPLGDALDTCLRGEIRDAVSVIGIWRTVRLIAEEAEETRRD
jgi:8-oxo-dGDP phosphatase